MTQWAVAPLAATALAEPRLMDASDEEGLRAFCEGARNPDDAQILAAYAVWLIARGEHARAHHALRTALACLARPVPVAMLALVLAAEHLSDDADTAALRRLLAMPLRADDRVARAAVALAEAFLARRAGRDDDAIAFASDAASGFRAIGWPLFEARALEAARRPAEAHAIYERCGATGDAERLRPRTSERPNRDGRTLTSRERMIAECIARGETNAQIGERMTISVKTVEKHVSSIFAKLDVRNRAQVAALFSGT